VISRTTRVWMLTALLVAVWMAGNAALDGRPTETDAARATAAAARDVEREGVQLAGGTP